MRGWGRGASSGAVILRHAIDDPRPAWGPSALVLRAMITMDHERGEGRATLAERLPPRGEALPATVPGPGRGHAGPQPGIQRRQEEASGCHGRPRRHIVVGGLALPPRLPTAGQGPNVARRLGIPSYPPAVVPVSARGLLGVTGSQRASVGGMVFAADCAPRAVGSARGHAVSW